MEGWQVIQDCKVLPDLFDRVKFIADIESLQQQDFNRFCKEYLHLREFYDLNKGTWVTDHIPHVQKHENLFWQLPHIEFDDPINFDKIQ